LLYDVWVFKKEIKRKIEQHRQLRPRSPCDCAHCCLEHLRGPRITRSPPLRWQDIKSPRGRPKEYNSEGYACMDMGYIFYKVTDQQIHTLRRDGARNQCESAAQWECGYCGSKRTAWLGTPQYRLKTPSQKVSLTLRMHMKGMAAADISDLIETPASTIQRWLDRGGQHSERLHAKRVWIWTGIDVRTRLLLGWAVGGRSQADAQTLMNQLVSRLTPDPYTFAKR
jgi:transposase-like protein